MTAWSIFRLTNERPLLAGYNNDLIQIRESNKGLFKMSINAPLYRYLYKLDDREVRAPLCLDTQYLAELFYTMDEKI